MSENKFSSPDYEVLGTLGKGAMGVVLKARHIHLDKVVAVKIISPEMAKDKEFAQRFLREMGTVISLNHPNLVQAIDYGMDIENDQLFVALEFVDGGSLKNLMDKNIQLPLGQALDFIKQISRGLQHAFEKHVIHRDIKPDNILLTQTHIAKITDFGLAKSDSHSSGLTLAGTILGTPYYLSPEQAMGEGKIDIRADIYSLGITLYHMLAGRPPFVGDNFLRIITAHCTKPIPPIKEFVPNLPKPVIEFLAKMVEKDPEDRFASPQQIVEAIEKLEKELDPALLAYDKPEAEPTREELASRRRRSKVKEEDISSALTLSGSLSADIIGMKGKLKTVSFPELIQTIIRSGKSGTLFLSKTENNATEKGEICFIKGEAIHASAGVVENEEAFLKLVSWTSGKFFFQEHEDANVPHTIQKPTNELLMEGLRLLDEKGKHIDGLDMNDPDSSLSGTLTGLAGNLDSINIFEVIQTMNVTRKTGTLILKDSQGTEKIHFQKGQIIHAESGDLQGKDAFFDLIFFKEGEFRFREEEEKVEKTIQVNTTALLMEAFQILQRENN